MSSVFALGEHPYGLTFFPESPMINVRSDINNVQWMTLYEEQPETASFNLTESTAGTSIAGPRRSVKGTFNCIIFNPDGDSKTVEDGTFYLEFLTP